MWVFVLRIITFPYRQSFKHFTLEPLAEIANNQHDAVKSRQLLASFKARKKSELHHIRQAATLSAAAVIGCFSWPNDTKPFWLATLLWHVSLWLSVFALISSTQETLLDQLPDTMQTDNDADEDIQGALAVLLVQVPIAHVEKGHSQSQRAEDPLMIWIWQYPMMLMSYSWSTFLIGYELYILTPVIRDESWTVESTCAIIASCAGLFVVSNFFINSAVARRRIKGCRSNICAAAAPTLGKVGDSVEIRTSEVVSQTENEVGQSHNS